MAAEQTFSGAGLDRAAALRRDPAWVRARRRDPASRAIATTRAGVLVSGGAAPRLVRLPLEQIPGGAGTTALLGLDGQGRALFAVDVDHIHAHRPLAAGAQALGLREAGALLSHEEAGIAAYAAALLAWHRDHAHCARCGGVTDAAAGGHLRTCPVCGAEHHPRTDPVAVVLVHDRDRVLLARHASWPPGRYSALAGAVEVGESLEEAVVRTIAEQTDVAAREPRYAGSQPWPFPRSLVLGFTAAYAGGAPAATDGALEDVRWFTREEVGAAAAGEPSRRSDANVGGGVLLPPPLALARRLLDDWLR